MKVHFFIILFAVMVGLVMDRLGWRRMEKRRRRQRQRRIERARSTGIDPLAYAPRKLRGRKEPSLRRRHNNRERMMADGESPLSIFLGVSIALVVLAGILGMLGSFGCQPGS